jgi:cation transporter-like permease
MKKLKTIGVKSVFVTSAILGAALGLVSGFGFMVSDVIDHQYLFGVLTFVFAPVLYGLLFSLCNALMAWVYNRVSERIGGIEVSFDE